MPIGSRISQEARTMPFTCLPRHVSECLWVLGPWVRHRHHLVFSWLLVLHLVDGDRATLKELSRHGPAHLAYQHGRRLLCAAYGCAKTLLWWFADHALQAFPPPDRKSTRLNSSHVKISYAVFCLKKKKIDK